MARVQNIFEKFGKNTIFNNTLYNIGCFSYLLCGEALASVHREAAVQTGTGK